MDFDSTDIYTAHKRGVERYTKKISFIFALFFSPLWCLCYYYTLLCFAVSRKIFFVIHASTNTTAKGHTKTLESGSSSEEVEKGSRIFFFGNKHHHSTQHRARAKRKQRTSTERANGSGTFSQKHSLNEKRRIFRVCRYILVSYIASTVTRRKWFHVEEISPLK